VWLGNLYNTEAAFSLRSRSCGGRLNVRYAFLLMLIALMGACVQSREGPPTMVPEPSLTSSPTSAVTGTSPPFTLNTPVIIVENPNPLPTETPWPLPGNLPMEKVAILRPGAGSQLTSPFRVRGWAGPSWNGRIELRLIGEDGRLISEMATYLFAIPGNAGPYTTEMEFVTPLVAEAARLEVYNLSREDGQPDHMASVNVILLSIGSPLIHYNIHGPEKLQLVQPKEFDTLRGGSVVVKGIGWADSDEALFADVLDSQGNVIGSSKFMIDAERIGSVGSFEVEVPYQVESSQVGRIAIYEPSASIPGMIHYTSVIVNLRP
jgi:hypothetical protein